MTGSHAAVHLLGDRLSERVGQLRPLSIHAKQPVDFGFNFFAEKEVILGVVAESLLVGFGELVLAMARICAILLEIIRKCSGTKWWTDPSRAAHVYLDLLADLLKLRHDLDAG